MDQNWNFQCFDIGKRKGKAGKEMGAIMGKGKRKGKEGADSGNQGSNPKSPLYACFLPQHNEIYMSVFSVITSFNHQNVNAEPSESINLVCIELDI